MSQIEHDNLTPLQNQPFWRSLDQLNGGSGALSPAKQEFTENASLLTDPVTRRNFMKIMGASLALAGVAGCSIRKPFQKVFPYASAPEHYVPGKSVYYATAMSVGNEAIGLLVESHDGRPTKIEGNPAHPSSFGAIKAIHQASVLQLYDPDRLQTILHNGVEASLSQFEEWIKEDAAYYSENKGEGLVILTETIPSPTYHRLLTLFQEKYPKSHIFNYDPINNDTQLQGVYEATGQYLTPDYQLNNADIIVALDSDFLGVDPNSIAYTKAFSKRRVPEAVEGMNRLYAFESHHTSTGSMADHRIRMKTSDIEPMLWALAEKLSQCGLALPSDIAALVKNGAKRGKGLISDKQVDLIATDLLSHRGRSAVIAGPKQPKTVHSLVYILNQALGNHGKTIQLHPSYIHSPIKPGSTVSSMLELSQLIRAKRVRTLLILGGDPVYTAPADSQFADLIKSVDQSVYISLFKNATGLSSNWTIPAMHYLETWSDITSINGTVAVGQPLLSPIYDTSVSNIEFLGHWLGLSKDAHTLVQETWKTEVIDFDEKWKKWLHGGILRGPQKGAPSSAYHNSGLTRSLEEAFSRKPAPGLELSFYPDAKVLDGRFINNGWLAELPDPVTKLTWDNAALISPKTATKYGVKSGDMVVLSIENRTITLPAFIEPGHADDSVSLFLGYGQKHAGRIGQDMGFDVYPLRTSAEMSMASGCILKATGDFYKLATTQEHGSMEGRPLYREGDIEEYEHHPEFAKEMEEVASQTALFKERDYKEGYQWGLSIDLSRCTGCNACMIACQSENNIPIVGKKQVLMGREMHWIRLDRYYEGPPEDAKLVKQPVTCLQCENAPCEPVCPVAATVHSNDGLNDMAYNRCVGTRYCANNCPAKVRRFNFLDFHATNPQSIKNDRHHLFDLFRVPATTVQEQFNPNVTVRMRGVMEKCTYCIQRINEGRNRANNENRLLYDGEVKTACMQTCPADAIVFGNILDPKSEVAKQRASGRQYEILGTLFLKARTTYMAAIKNPNPKWSLS